MDCRLLLIIAAYVLGSICTGYYLVRLRMGIDVRDTGSGGVGARNVGRLLGRYGFIITLLGDAIKGMLAVALAQHFCSSQIIVALVFVAVLLGHIWPLFLQLRGGRGVATAIGAYSVFAPLLLVVFLVIATILVLAKRGVIYSGLITFALLPFVAFFMQLPIENIVAVFCSSLIILIAHRKYLLLMVRY